MVDQVLFCFFHLGFLGVNDYSIFFFFFAVGENHTKQTCEPQNCQALCNRKW